MVHDDGDAVGGRDDRTRGCGASPPGEEQPIERDPEADGDDDREPDPGGDVDEQEVDRGRVAVLQDEDQRDDGDDDERDQPRRDRVALSSQLPALSHRVERLLFVHAGTLRQRLGVEADLLAGVGRHDVAVAAGDGVPVLGDQLGRQVGGEVALALADEDLGDAAGRDGEHPARRLAGLVGEVGDDRRDEVRRQLLADAARGSRSCA